MIKMTAIDPAKPEGELITDEQVARLREIRVEAAKLDVFSEFRKVIIDEFGPRLERSSPASKARFAAGGGCQE